MRQLREKNKINYSQAEASLPQTWRAAIRKAGLTYRKSYPSRHTYACWSFSAGANPDFIASQMGHANAQRVYQVYSYWMKENDEAQRSLLNEKVNEFAPQVSHTKAFPSTYLSASISPA